MGMPGFNGEASLYVGARSYYGGVRALSGAAATVVPQQDPSCTVSCSDWRNCNATCGSWPPGFSNYQCWLDCLAPIVDCLQGSTCYPPPVDCTTTGCKPGKVCCDCVSPAPCVSADYCRKVLCRL
jgi:hypothetical protein